MALKTSIAYLAARLKERTTWAGILTAIAGGVGFPSPYNHFAVVAGVIAAIAPSPKVGGSDNG